MVFQKRYFPENENVFKELAEIRKKRCVSIESIHRKTKIPLKYLRALETGSTETLPDILYVKNIIKKYLQIFGIDSRPYISRLKLERDDSAGSNSIASAKPLIVFSRIIKTAAAALAVIAFIAFLGYELNNIFRPSAIEIYSPADGAGVSQATIQILGKTEKGSALFINNEQVILNKDGTFAKEINLQKGLNLIKISGMRRYSRENVIWRNVILEIK